MTRSASNPASKLYVPTNTTRGESPNASGIVRSTAMLCMSTLALLPFDGIAAAGVTGVTGAHAAVPGAPSAVINGRLGTPRPTTTPRIGIATGSAVADAAMRGDIAEVRAQLQRGGDVNAAQGDGMTALHWAASRGDSTLARVLVQARANLAAKTRIGAYMPLHIAAREAHSSVVRVLLRAGADASALNAEGVTPLHLAAMGGDTSIVLALLRAGSDVNATEPAWGQTPLMVAAGRGRGDAVRALLAHGADTKRVAKTMDPMESSAQDRQAKQVRNGVLAKLREEQGQSKNPNWQPDSRQVQAAVTAALAVERKGASAEALAGAAAATATEEARLAAQGGAGLDDDSPGYTELLGLQGGHTALLLAVREGNEDAVKALVAGGADINQVSGGDHTSPLLMAAINGHYDLAMVLLKAGADPNLASDAGATPLFGILNKEWAPTTRTPQPAYQLQQQTTYLEVMSALLKAKADPNARLKRSLWYTTYNRDNLRVDFSGATPFFRAAYATDVPAMQLLLAAGADPSIGTLKPVARVRRALPGSTGPVAPREDPSGLPPVPEGGIGVLPLHAASGVGYGQGFAANDHRHVTDGWMPSVKFLVETLHVDVNARDYSGYTALHHAAARGDNEMIRYLVSKGADVKAVSRSGQTTADMANGPVQRISPYLDTVKLLEELGSKNNHKCISC